MNKMLELEVEAREAKLIAVKAAVGTDAAKLFVQSYLGGLNDWTTSTPRARLKRGNEAAFISIGIKGDPWARFDRFKDGVHAHRG